MSIWPTTISASYSQGIESAARRLSALARKVSTATPISQTEAINAELASIRLEVRKLERAARCDQRRHNEDRRIQARAAAKYATVEARAAAERDAAISQARMASLVGA